MTGLKEGRTEKDDLLVKEGPEVCEHSFGVLYTTETKL